MAARNLFRAGNCTLIALVATLGAGTAHAQSIRPLSTDRPDRTESP